MSTEKTIIVEQSQRSCSGILIPISLAEPGLCWGKMEVVVPQKPFISRGSQQNEGRYIVLCYCQGHHPTSQNCFTCSFSRLHCFRTSPWMEYRLTSALFFCQMSISLQIGWQHFQKWQRFHHICSTFIQEVFSVLFCLLACFSHQSNKHSKVLQHIYSHLISLFQAKPLPALSCDVLCSGYI